jgi:hypothetical protein
MFSLWLWDGIEIRPVAVRTNQLLVSLTVPDDAMRECDRMRAILLLERDLIAHYHAGNEEGGGLGRMRWLLRWSGAGSRRE